MFCLKGKTALITGASGAIGAATARIFSQAGAKLVISGTRVEALNKLKDELGSEVAVVACDLNNYSQIESMMEKIEEQLEVVDILVCNAGIIKDNLALRMNMEDFDNVVKVNLSSSFLLNKLAIKKMIKKRWGRIINISSVVGFAGNAGQSNYCASKAGLVGMSKAMAQEVASRGVTVNCIAPGFVASAMTEALKDEYKEKLKSQIPCNELGQPEDIAYAALYLASDEAKYMTGQTLHVNGGMIMV